MNPTVATILYVVNSLGWSLVGFAVGWLAGGARRDVRVIKEAVVPDEDDDEKARPRWMGGMDATRWLGIVVAILAVVTVTQSYLASRRLSEVTDCQADYNQRIVDVTRIRSQLADEDRTALNTMLLTIYTKRDDKPAQLAAYTAWVNTVRTNEVERKQHPLPEWPGGDCR